MSSSNPTPSRRPKSATTICSNCKTLIEFTVISNNDPDGWLHVQCFQCSDVVRVPSNIVAASTLPSFNPSSASPSSSSTNTRSDHASSATSNQQQQQQKQAPPPKKPTKAFGKTGTDENPLERDLYDILEVDPKATPAQIKKAYYLLAMKWHPDKNRDDPQAEERFKKISEAYQTLSDPQKRTAYNTYGSSQNGGEAMFMDPEEFFKQQFGGDKFSDLIGEISIAKDFKEAMNSMSKEDEATPTLPSQDMVDRLEVREVRVTKLVINLVDKLSLFTDAFPISDPEIMAGKYTSMDDLTVAAQSLLVTMEPIALEALTNFRSVAAIEADMLKTESYGVELLHAIGFTYGLKAGQHAAKLEAEGDGNVLKRAWGFGSRWMGMMREKAHIVNETMGTFKTALDLQTSFTKLQEMEKKKEARAAAASAGVTDGSTPSSAAAGGGAGHPAESVKKDATKPDADDEPPGADGLTTRERELKQKLEQEAATKGLEALWRGSKLEVESVLREVCDRVLDDKTVLREVRRRRVEALKVLGSVFESVKLEVPAATTAPPVKGFSFALSDLFVLGPQRS